MECLNNVECQFEQQLIKKLAKIVLASVRFFNPFFLIIIQ